MKDWGAGVYFDQLQEVATARQLDYTIPGLAWAVENRPAQPVRRAAGLRRFVAEHNKT